MIWSTDPMTLLPPWLQWAMQWQMTEGGRGFMILRSR